MTNESGYLDANGARIYWEAEGNGSSVLLIHGGLGSLRMWDGVVPALADRHRVIRFDTRGFGRTDTEDVEFSNRADALAVLDRVGVERAHVVGQSRGGVIGLDLAIERPDRVASLVSVAGGISGLDEPEPPEGIEVPPWDRMEKLWEAKDWEELAELETQVWVDGWGQPTTRVDPALRVQVHDWILSNYQAQKAEGKPKPLDPPAAGRLDEVRIPILVMIGTADEPGVVVAQRHLADSVAGARVELFDGVAHMIQLEQVDRFARVVLEFLAEVGAGG